MSKKTELSIDGIKITDVSGTMPYHTSPIYIMYLSNTENVFSTTHIRTNDIDHKKINHFEKIGHFKCSTD